MTPQSAVPTINPCTPSAVVLGTLDVEGIEGKISGSLAAKVRQLVDDYPDRALEVIRTWMDEDRRH